MSEINKKDIFCASCQDFKAHTLVVESKNSEILASCECGRNLKFPLFDKPSDLIDALNKHHQANQGQFTNQALNIKHTDSENKLKELLNNN